MERLRSVETEQYTLEVIECDCGLHIGVDATFLDQLGDMKFDCPSCKRPIDTAIVIPDTVP